MKIRASFAKMLLLMSAIFLITCRPETASSQATTVQPELAEEEAINRYLRQGAWKHRIFAPEWQLFIDSAIAIHPNIAYLYQQKAMPYFKQQKYEAGLAILDKAVALDSARWIDYRAFIKCIFARRYREAIDDLEASKRIKGIDGHVMDHSYDFYLGLCHLQLNAFEEAEKFLRSSVEATRRRSGDEWVHALDLFYLGIAQYEQQHDEAAIETLDRALVRYPNFADAEHYKAICLARLGRFDEAKRLLDDCEKHLSAGYTINEDNAIYEQYPYQIRQWHIDMMRSRQ